MPKICEYDGCTNPIWSRKTMRCKMHLSSQPATPKKTKLKKVTQKIKQVSSKRQRQNQAYLIMRKMFLETHERCEKCGGVATDLHHKRLRGEYFLDSTTFAALCRPCHDWVHRNPKEAKEQGWLIRGK